MGVVECGGVDYTTYYGEITLKRKGGAVKFAKAKNMDEELANKEKQKISDGDSIATGRKSFITIMGHPQDGKMQMLTLLPDSEATLRMKCWEGKAGGETRKGIGISKIECAKGTFVIYPASAKLEIPLVEITHIDKKREMKLIADVLPGMTVILPGSRMEVKGDGKSCETWPAYGSMGMTELMVTASGMYEKTMEVDERAGMLSGALLKFGLGMPVDLNHEEKMMDYSARKMRENRAKSQEFAKQLPTEEDLGKMEKSGKFNQSQIELAKAASKAAKVSGGPGTPAFGINMLATMDFSKMKDMPGLTPEQKRQIEEAMPQMAKMQKEFASSGKLAQMAAQASLSEKFMETAANDPVAKKHINKAYSEIKEKMDSFSLPPYPKPDEKFRVK